MFSCFYRQGQATKPIAVRARIASARTPFGWVVKGLMDSKQGMPVSLRIDSWLSRATYLPGGNDNPPWRHLDGDGDWADSWVVI